MVKFVFVTGGVLSSVGKGVVTSSIGKMLQIRGFSVTAIKIDPYVNVDAGTMNPYMHGEVFVTDDGGETDLDLGCYERFLDLDLNKENNITTGQIYQTVIDLMVEQRSLTYKGATMRLGAHKILIKRGTLAHNLYGNTEIYERHRHRWEVNPKYWSILEKNGLVFSGKSPDGKRIEILEHSKNFFFFASQFHGEFKSRPGKPEPEYYGFIKAGLEKKCSSL